MDYKVLGQTVPAVEITLNQGESIYSQRGGMTWQTDGIKMSTSGKGGVMKSIGRIFTGESIFMNTYTAERNNVTIAFGSTVPGQIVPVDLSQIPQGLMVQKGSFLCAEPSVEVSLAFTKKFSSGLFGGEGFILQKMQGSGKAFLEVDGDVVKKELQPGEIIKVDTGNVVAFQSSVAYEIETVKGLGNIFLGGEGLFLTKLTGPGTVILQTQNFVDFANRIISLIPPKNN